MESVKRTNRSSRGAQGAFQDPASILGIEPAVPKNAAPDPILESALLHTLVTRLSQLQILSNKPIQTSWQLIADAAQGSASGRDAFGQRYFPIVRAYLSKRWHGGRLAQEIDDAVQEVFVECFRQGGALEKVERSRGSSFRGFLFGIVRNVALRIESAAAARFAKLRTETEFLEGIEAREGRLTRVFELEWARLVVRPAGELQRNDARESGGNRLQRFEVLQLHLVEGLQAPAIAERLGVKVELVHKWLSRARDDFAACLALVVREHSPELQQADEIELECRRVLALLE